MNRVMRKDYVPKLRFDEVLRKFHEQGQTQRNAIIVDLNYMGYLDIWKKKDLEVMHGVKQRDYVLKLGHREVLCKFHEQKWRHRDADIVDLN